MSVRGFRGLRVLVTGHRGFIGSRLYDELELAGADLLGVDRIDGWDLRDRDVLVEIERFAPALVFHLAAEHVVPWCREHPTETLDANVVGLARLLGVLGHLCGRFVFASSAAVYGYGCPVAELTKLSPVDVYGQSKWLGEELLRVWSFDRMSDVVNARLFNVVGPGDRNPHVVPALVARYLSGGGIRHGNLEPLRDYVHVDDVVRALLMLGELNAPTGTFNVGTGIGVSVGTLLRLIQEVGGHPLEPDRDPGLMRLEDGDLVADVSKLRGLGWEPQKTLADAIREVIDGG